MSVRRINLLLWTCAAAMAAGAAAVLALAVMMPVEVTPLPGAARADRAPTTRAGTAGLPDLVAFEPVWKLDLRKSLTATVAPSQAQAVTAAAKTDSGLPITLVGTIGDSLALVKTRNGEVEVKAAGESAAGVKIVTVRPSQVDVEFGGQVVTLTIPKEPTGG